MCRNIAFNRTRRHYYFFFFYFLTCYIASIKYVYNNVTHLLLESALNIRVRACVRMYDCLSYVFGVCVCMYMYASWIFHFALELACTRSCNASLEKKKNFWVRRAWVIDDPWYLLEEIYRFTRSAWRKIDTVNPLLSKIFLASEKNCVTLINNGNIGYLVEKTF